MLPGRQMDLFDEIRLNSSRRCSCAYMEFLLISAPERAHQLRTGPLNCRAPGLAPTGWPAASGRWRWWWLMLLLLFSGAYCREEGETEEEEEEDLIQDFMSASACVLACAHLCKVRASAPAARRTQPWGTRTLACRRADPGLALFLRARRRTDKAHGFHHWDIPQP